MKPYFVYTFPWDNSSAGNIVLHKLADALSKRFPDFVYTLSPDSRVEAKHLSKCNVHPKDCIAVYPEVFGGNPFNCGTIVRYLLNIPGIFGGPKCFAREEIQFAFSNFLIEFFTIEVNTTLLFFFFSLTLFPLIELFKFAIFSPPFNTY